MEFVRWSSNVSGRRLGRIEPDDLMSERPKAISPAARIALVLLGLTSGAVVAAASGALLGATLRVQEAELRDGVAPQIVIGGIRS